MKISIYYETFPLSYPYYKDMHQNDIPRWHLEKERKGTIELGICKHCGARAYRYLGRLSGVFHVESLGAGCRDGLGIVEFVSDVREIVNRFYS